jgi:hypothetical protein
MPTGPQCHSTGIFASAQSPVELHGARGRRAAPSGRRGAPSRLGRRVAPARRAFLRRRASRGAPSRTTAACRGSCLGRRARRSRCGSAPGSRWARAPSARCRAPPSREIRFGIVWVRRMPVGPDRARGEVGLELAEVLLREVAVRVRHEVDRAARGQVVLGPIPVFVEVDLHRAHVRERDVRVHVEDRPEPFVLQDHAVLERRKPR